MSDLQYKCPGCGAPINFDPSSQGMTCEFCTQSFDVATVEKFNAGLHAQAGGSPSSMPPSPTGSGMPPAPVMSEGGPPQTAEQGADFQWKGAPETFLDEKTQQMMAQFICNSCGGEIIGSPDLVSSRCPYCDNNFIAPTQLTSTRVPDRMIPFNVSKEQMTASFQAASKGLLFLPGDFKNRHKIEDAKGVYLPYWLYDCNVAAQISYTGQQSRTWREGNYEYTQTDYYQLMRGGYVGFDDIPVSGTKDVDEERTEGIEPFDYRGTQPFATAYLAGYATNKYNIAPEVANERANERVKVSTEEVFESTTGGYSNVQVQYSNIQLSKGIVEYVFLPTYLLNLSYGGKKYPFAINGQTGKTVGEFPISKGKMYGFLAGLGVAATALLAYPVIFLVAVFMG
ncbi:MAG: ATP-binding protein [Actinomycetaceae bacterium]|nr:ATP-binding protein [Actinomycetaceae bacterium]